MATYPVPYDWRTMPQRGMPSITYYAGRSTPVSPYVFVLRCRDCGQGWYAGSPVVLDPCPSCDGMLMIAKLWDTRLSRHPWAEPLLAKLYRHFAGKLPHNEP